MKLLSVIFLPLLATGVFAQDAEPEEELVEVRRYTVEMIIFAYEQEVSARSEIFMPDEPPPPEIGEDGELIEIVLDDGTVIGADGKDDGPELTEIELLVRERQSELAEIDERYAFIMLPEEELVLQDVLAGLDELDAYTPLMHFGWTQPTYPEEETEIRPLSFFATPPEGLEGGLSLYLSRYLHLALNLQLDSTTLAKLDETEALLDGEESEEEEVPDPYYFSDGINEIDMADFATVTYPTRYRIDEDRIFRNGELRYYDHPKFGVLAQITRVEEADPDELGEELLGYDGE
jgi:hypothetical protein